MDKKQLKGYQLDLIRQVTAALAVCETPDRPLVPVLDFVTFTTETGGTYKVGNTQKRLREFRDLVAKSRGFAPKWKGRRVFTPSLSMTASPEARAAVMAEAEEVES